LDALLDPATYDLVVEDAEARSVDGWRHVFGVRKT